MHSIHDIRRSATALGVMLIAAGSMAQTITNPSFEADSFAVAPGLIVDNSAITGWNANFAELAGLNPAGGTSPVANNGAVPDGVNVAFLKAGFASLSTTLQGLTAGQAYRVTFRANAATGQAPNMTVYIGGVAVFPVDSPIAIYPAGASNPYATVAFDFTATASSQVLEVTNESTGEDTLLIDAFTIKPSDARWSVDAWNDDESSGVDPNYVYTHAYNFGGGPNTAINSVPFTGVPGANPSIPNVFSTTYLGSIFNGDANNVTGGSRAMANDFLYGGAVPAGSFQSITMMGLTPGAEYVATIYTVGWEAASATIRWATFGMGEDRITLNQDAMGDNGGLRISHRYTADATGSATLRIAPMNPANVTIHVYGFSNREAVSRNVAPTISEDPQGTTVSSGIPVTLRVLASGIPTPTYQWRRNGSNIPGASDSTYAIAAATAGDAGTYDVVVSNIKGSVTSRSAGVVVGIPLENASFETDVFFVFPGYVSGNGPITGWTSLGNHGLNPAAGIPFANNGTIPNGAQAAFMQGDGALSQTVANLAIGSHYYLHYYENSRSGYNAPSLEAKLNDLTLVPAHSVPAVGGSKPYTEVFSDVFAATSTEGTLSFVKTNPLGGDTTAVLDNVAIVEVPAGTTPTIVREPAALVVSVGDSATFSAQAIGSLPLSYQWLKNGSPISGATAQKLTLGNIQKPDEADYSVRISNTAGNDTSSVAHLTVFEPIPDLYNTGVNDSRAPLADGAVDAHYRLLENPDTGSADSIVEDSTLFPIVAGPWLANTTKSKWIGPRRNTSASAIGTFVYRTTFNVGDRDPSTVVILGGWATDNSGRDIRVNGQSISPATSPGFAGYTPFTISATNAHLITGVNTIDFVVANEAAIGYTGLRVDIFRSNLKVPTGTPPQITTHPLSQTVVEGDTVTFTGAAEGTSPLFYQWRKNGNPLPGQNSLTLTIANALFADSGSYSLMVSNTAGTALSDPAILKVAYRPMPGVFGTGVGPDGTLLPGGSVDPHYVLTQSADDGFPGPDAIVLDDAWPIGAWLPHGPKSKWISMQSSQAVGNAEGQYTFRTTFDLTGLDPSKVRIEGGWAVDNDGLDILLNGTSTGLKVSGFGGLVPFTITSGLVAGVNTLDFVISNAPATPNPVGLRVDLRGLYEILGPTRPQLQVTRSGAGVVINWAPASAGQKLQSAPDATGPWIDVTGATAPYNAPATGARKFFRVIE